MGWRILRAGFLVVKDAETSEKVRFSIKSLDNDDIRHCESAIGRNMLENMV
jgi:hypothetical protein